MDARCVDAEVQLDVDVMILEYTLFHAVEVRFRPASVVHQGSHDEAKVQEALRLLRIFDSFVHVFNQVHPKYEHSPELNFRMDILEFLVLLDGLSSTILPHMADGMMETLRIRAQDDINSRRNWQTARQRYLRRLEKHTSMPSTEEIERDVERLIYATWSNSHAWTRRHILSIDRILILHTLLSRFMVISAKVSDLIDQIIDQEWMQFACELMLQVGIEALLLQTNGYQAKALPSLEDCFAWGYIDPGSTQLPIATASSKEEMAELVNKMLRSPSTSKSIAGLENPHWTKLRVKTLDEFALAPGASLEAKTFRLQRLSEKCPWDVFSRKLRSFAQNMWDLSCENDHMGKPVLVEIEEGHLQSLNIVGADFEDFMSKVHQTRGSCLDHDAAAKVQLFEVNGLLQEQNLQDLYHYQRQAQEQTNLRAYDTTISIKLED